MMGKPQVTVQEYTIFSAQSGLKGPIKGHKDTTFRHIVDAFVRSMKEAIAWQIQKQKFILTSESLIFVSATVDDKGFETNHGFYSGTLRYAVTAKRIDGLSEAALKAAIKEAGESLGIRLIYQTSLRIMEPTVRVF